MIVSRKELERLWDETTPKLFGYLVNTLRDKAAAEDVLQTTWLKAIKAIPRYENRGLPFASWLFAIARNECKERWRTTNREVALDVEEHDMGQAPSSDHVLAQQILAKLDETDRELLRLRYIADLPIHDIAKILNINLIAVRVRIHRALKRAKHYA